jgi:two-component system, OmpR family, alkaline phosphatase synthesis response regulator PhoP
MATVKAQPISPAKILLIEDEKGLSIALRDRLLSEGYAVDIAADGETGLQKAFSLTCDLIVLDIMLPARDGLSVCREIRKAGINTPILVLSARSETVDKIVGLKLGADAYMTKPFDMLEFIARVEALLRHTPPPAYAWVRKVGSIRVDVRASEVTREGVPVHLSLLEFRLLCYFLRNRGSALSREKILHEVWGHHNVVTPTRTVDVHVAALRQKLESDPAQPELIVTVPKIGYKFAEHKEDSLRDMRLSQKSVYEQW